MRKITKIEIITRASKLEELKSKKNELIMNMEKSTAKNGVDAIIDIIMKSI